MQMSSWNFKETKKRSRYISLRLVFQLISLRGLKVGEIFKEFLVLSTKDVIDGGKL
jgi:hypothetical protein